MNITLWAIAVIIGSVCSYQAGKWYEERVNRTKQKTIVMVGTLVVREHGMMRVVPMRCAFRSTEEAIGEIYRAINGIVPESDGVAVERLLSECKIEGENNAS